MIKEQSLLNIYLIKYFQWSIVAIIVLAYFIVIWLYALNIPIGDDYDNILKFYIEWNDVKSSNQAIDILFSQHNEHRLLFNRLVFLALDFFHQLDFHLIILIGNIALLGILFLYIYLNYQNSFIFPLTIISALLIFQFSGYETSLWAMASVSNYYVIFFAFLTFIFLTKDTSFYFGLALLFSGLSIYTQGNGLIVPILGLLYLLINYLKAPKKNIHYYIILWGIFSALFIAFYFFNYTKPGNHPSIFEALTQPVHVINYFLAFIGSLGYYFSKFIGLSNVQSIWWAVILGFWIIILFLYLTWKKYYIYQPALYLFILFLLGNAVMASLGRSEFGIAQAFSSRYTINSILLLLSSIYAAFFYINNITLKNLSVVYIIVIIAWIYNVSTYIHYIPIISNKKIELIGGAYLFLHKNSIDHLLHPEKLHAANILNLAYEKKIYSIDKILQKINFTDREIKYIENLKSLKTRLHIHTVLNSILKKASFRLNRTGGSVSIVQKNNFIIIDGWHDIEDTEKKINIYITTPKQPLSTQIKTIKRPDVAAALKKPNLFNSGFYIILEFNNPIPPDEICVAYDKADFSITLLGNSSKFCYSLLITNVN